MATVVNEAFNEVRPYCVEFIQSQSLQSLKKLHKKLKSLDKDSMDEIIPYILFPFRVILKNQESRNEDFLLDLTDCLAYLFNCAIVNDWGIVNELLTFLCSIISSPTNKEIGASGSEELKLSVAFAIGALIDHASLPVWHNLYHYFNIPLLGHIVTLLLSIAKDNIERQARLTALKALQSLCQPSYLSSLEESSQYTANKVIGDCMACFLPGVATALSKIIVTDASAGNKVKSSCLDILGVFITFTMGDKNLVNYSKETKVEGDMDPRLKSLVVTRDKNWVETAAKKLIPIIENACSASNSEEWQVRLSCVNLCGKILSKCHDSMKNHANTLLKIPVKLLNDNYKQIRDNCNKILDNFSSCLQEDSPGSQILVEILEENLFALCTSLPRLMRTLQDAEKASTLKILLGYLTLLKEKINNLLYSQAHLKKLSAALLHSFELENSSIQRIDIVESSKSVSLEKNDFLRTCFRKQFCHFLDRNIYNILRTICNILGQYGDLEILLDHFLDVYNTSETNCKQAVLILNEILIGAKRNVGEKVTSCVSTLLDEYLSPDNWYLATKYDSEYLQSHHQARIQKMNKFEQKMAVVPSLSQPLNETSLKSLKSNILLCCLHLESILTFSFILGHKFQSFLMHALYPLLEKTTDSNTSITTCAVRTMQGVAINCGYKSASELIAENADYLISDISMQIHQLKLFPRCPSVLKAMLDHSTSDILPLVSDTTDEILLSLDLHHLEHERLLVFLPVLHSVVEAVKRWTQRENCDMSEIANDISKTDPSTKKHAPSSNDQIIKKDKSSVREKIKKNAFDNGKSVINEGLNSCDSLGDSKERAPLTLVDQIVCEDLPSKPCKIFAESLRKQLLEFHRNKKIAELEADVEIDPNWKPEQEEDEQYQHPHQEEEEKKIPMDIQITSKVLNRCMHLMAHSDPRVRIKVMEIIEVGMIVIKSCENELLPMAHKLWSPLVARFADKENQVVMKAFDTLCVIASLSKDFLRKRFCKEILPKILSILQNQAKQSSKLKKGSSTNSSIKIPGYKFVSQETIAYTHSVAYKLQKKTLSKLGQLLQDLEISRIDHISVCNACMPYLSIKQPLSLQIAAVKLFQNLMKIDPDLTWLRLNGVWCPGSVLFPPEDLKNRSTGSNFQVVYLGGSTDAGNEFASNVKILLDGIGD